MSRKNSSFSQLVDYMNKEGEREKIFDIYHNIYASDSKEFIAEEFKKNAEFLKERKNGNMFYHEMVSVTKSKSISIEKQKEILRDLVKDYIELRAKNNLVYAVMHTDKKDNLHYHLMISSNEYKNEKKHRLSKTGFAKIQKEIEKYVLNNYPQMEQKIIYNQEKKSEKTKSSEFEFKKRTGKESQRDSVKRRLNEVFEKSKTKQEFFNNLADNNFELYVHGNTIGVTCKETKKNYRLKTLGLLNDFYKISPAIQEAENRKEEIKKSREESQKEKVDTRSYRSATMKEERPKTKEERLNESQPYQESHEVHYSEAELEIQKRKEEIRKSKTGNGDSKDYSNDKMR